MYDIQVTAGALRAAAAFARYDDNAPDITLTAATGRVVIRQGNRTLITADCDESASGQVEITPQALREAANWSNDGADMAAVELLVDDRMLLVTQGDDRTGFDTGGEPASEEYLAVAPLDREG